MRASVRGPRNIPHKSQLHMSPNFVHLDHTESYTYSAKICAGILTLGKQPEKALSGPLRSYGRVMKLNPPAPEAHQQ